MACGVPAIFCHSLGLPGPARHELTVVVDVAAQVVDWAAACFPGAGADADLRVDADMPNEREWATRQWEAHQMTFLAQLHVRRIASIWCPTEWGD